MKAAACLVLLLITLSGCAGPPRWVWKHPHHDEERTQLDLEQCRRAAAQGMPGTPLVTPQLAADFYEERQDLIRQCMEAQGYHYERVDRTRK